MLKKVLFAFLALVCLFSCSRTEPRIPFGFMELTYYPGEARPQERFSFFFIAEDDDGMANLEELRLYHDRDGLEWILSHEDWVYLEEGERYWIGSRSIAMIEDGTLPRGLYGAVLFNKGGEKTEQLFTFDAPENPRFPYPSFRLEGSNFSINSQYPENFFIVYDQQGNIVRTIPVVNTFGNTFELELPNNARLLALWARDEVYHTSALTEALALN
jgi:hypothetical protein